MADRKNRSSLGSMFGSLAWPLILGLGATRSRISAYALPQHRLHGRRWPASPAGRSLSRAGRRQGFHETRWAAWNLVRVATSTGAFGFLAWALVLYDRSTP